MELLESFNLPEIQKMFSPKTTSNSYDAFYDAQERHFKLAVIYSQEKDLPKRMWMGFCSVGDQKLRGDQGLTWRGCYHSIEYLKVQASHSIHAKSVIACSSSWQ